MIHYLAKRTGHRLVRINNHEHTDIQEYIGQYITDPLTGKLKFQEGILVEAVKNVCNPPITRFNLYLLFYSFTQSMISSILSKF
jgi:MoxR-like ATPase